MAHIATIARFNKCDGCGQPFENKSQVVALIPNIELEINKLDNTKTRLKVSDDGINSRAILIFCRKCLNINNYVDEENSPNLNNKGV